MEFLAGYGEENENSSPGMTDKKRVKGKETSDSSGNLQAEWESFEKMICGGEKTAGVSSSDSSSYLPDGVVAYPSFGKPRQRSNTESSAEQKSANSVKSSEAMQFSFEEVQNISLPPEVPQVSRSRSASISSRSSSPSSKSRSSSASSSVHSDDSDHEVRGKDKKSHRVSTESKEDKIPTPPKASKSRTSRSSTSPTKRKRSKSRSKSRSPSRKRRSRSRSHSRRKRSRRSHGRRHRSSSRSRRHRRRRSKQRSRSRDRRRRKHRHSSRDRHSRSRSRERRRKRRSSRSRSRSKDRRKRSHRRTRSRSRSRGRGRHSRSRSRSHSRERTSRIPSVSSYSGHPVSKDKPLTFKEQMRQQLLKASKFLQNGEHTEGDEPLELPKEKSSNLRLNQTSILSAMAASVSSAASGVTPQMALLQTMAAMHQKAQEMTGVSVPKYYNPAAVNPLKYAEQVQKRKLLWSKNKDKSSDKDKDKEKEWQATSFVSDSDGKMAAKFRKLMGMKEGEETTEEDEEAPKLSEEQQKKQQELFSRLDREYEFARMTTHTHRGVGLGFTSQGTYPNT